MKQIRNYIAVAVLMLLLSLSAIQHLETFKDNSPQQSLKVHADISGKLSAAILNETPRSNHRGINALIIFQTFKNGSALGIGDLDNSLRERFYYFFSMVDLYHYAPLHKIELS